jgi:hypothetical protein
MLCEWECISLAVLLDRVFLELLVVSNGSSWGV